MHGRIAPHTTKNIVENIEPEYQNEHRKRTSRMNIENEHREYISKINIENEHRLKCTSKNKIFRGCRIPKFKTAAKRTRQYCVLFNAPMPQILQRQCDGLQSTTSNMELEVEGNSQSTTAMKNRVRLLRKESRKQVKEAGMFGLKRRSRWQRHLT